MQILCNTDEHANEEAIEVGPVPLQQQFVDHPVLENTVQPQTQDKKRKMMLKNKEEMRNMKNTKNKTIHKHKVKIKKMSMRTQIL